MNTILEIIIVAAFAVLYGLAWHNQPPREPVTTRRVNPTRKPLA